MKPQIETPPKIVDDARNALYSKEFDELIKGADVKRGKILPILR